MVNLGRLYESLYAGAYSYLGVYVIDENVGRKTVIGLRVYDLTGIQTPPWLWRSVSGAALLTLGILDYWVARGALTQFYSLPIAASAFSDGWRGGLTAAALSSIIVFAVPGEATATARAVNVLALLCLGLLIAFISDKERKRRSRLLKQAEQLSSVYEKVQANFEGMKRVERLSAIGQLSAGLAHEIRNPLASISGAAAILQRNESLDPKHAKCVEIIASECHRLDGLLTNFLNFARPRPPRLQTIQLDAVLDNILALANHGIRGKLVHCDMQIQPSLPHVECDPEQLEQVLLNLMINAIEASPDGGNVTLSAAAEKGKVAVRVIDHGHGVAPAHLDRLFDPFFTTKEHGTGLGLPVAHQIMTQMGGMLLAERNSDQGMTFTVVLPAKHSAA